MQSPTAIKLLISDVDGTLVTSDKRLTPATLAAARKLRDHGIGLAVTSGRPPLGMKMLLEPLALSAPLAGFNGGLFVEPSLAVLQTHALSQADTHEIISFLDRRGVDVWAYQGERWLLRDPAKAHVDKERRTVQFEPEVTPELHAIAGETIKIVGVSDDAGLLVDCESAVHAAFGARVSASRSQPYYLDITHPRANKGEVVDFLAAYFSIPHQAIATIGDGHNDCLMFRRSGLSIAMGNGDDVVKKCASSSTASNDEDGWAQAVERFIVPGA